MSDTQNEYEAERAARIAANRAKMEQLGLVEASRALTGAARRDALAPMHHGALQAPRLRQPPKPKKKAAGDEQPQRVSKRLRGQAAPAEAEAAAVGRVEAAEDAALGRTGRGAGRRALTLPPATSYAAPFSLRAIGTTVWELGQVHRGAWAPRYWSSAQCLYHHAYPVGYRATKSHFGREFEMRIEAGPTGPVFIVEEAGGGGARFAGETPTRPWTDVCLAQRTGQRISGPLFFGFSDPVTQRAIAAGLYTPQELQAALAGEVVQTEQPGDDELAARDFERLDGVGAAAALALARTLALGGARHSGVAALGAWVRATPANREALTQYLRTSEEVPAASRRWPQWRTRIVPKIVAALERAGERAATAAAAAAAGPSAAGASPGAPL